MVMFMELNMEIITYRSILSANLLQISHRVVYAGFTRS